MGIFGGGGGGGDSGAATVQAVKPVPPPAQVSASLAAVRGSKAASMEGGDLGGTILAGATAKPPPGSEIRSPGEVLYGKKLTGA